MAKSSKYPRVVLSGEVEGSAGHAYRVVQLSRHDIVVETSSEIDALGERIWLTHCPSMDSEMDLATVFARGICELMDRRDRAARARRRRARRVRE